MEENKNGKSADENRKTMGLSLSDTAYYNVNGAEPGAENVIPETDPPEKRKRRGFLLPFLLGAFCCALGLFAATELFGLGKFVSKDDYAYYRDLDDSYGKYYEIMRLIDEDPIAEKGSGKIGDEQLKEIVASTGDPYAEYFTAAEYAEFMKRYSSDYIGIGIGVVQDGDDITVISVFEDTPASEAGIENGDVIIKIDGKTPADVDDAIDMLSGKPGTPVTVTFRRGGDETEVKMNRAKIDQDSIKYYKVDGTDDVGYIKIASFIEGTDKDFKAAVKELKKDVCTKFIIDLRDNPGGDVDVTLSIADMFISNSNLLSISYKDTSKNVTYVANNGVTVSPDVEVAILVNGGTASSAEIFSSAMKDNGRAVLFGTQTYGKGVMQVISSFGTGYTSITTASFVGPAGKTIHGEGVEPDFVIEDLTVTDDELEAYTELINSKAVEQFVDQNPEYSTANISKFAEEHADSGIREEVLLLVARNEYLLRMTYDERPLVDIVYDDVCKAAYEYLQDYEINYDANYLPASGSSNRVVNF